MALLHIRRGRVSYKSIGVEFDVRIVLDDFLQLPADIKWIWLSCRLNLPDRPKTILKSFCAASVVRGC